MAKNDTSTTGQAAASRGADGRPVLEIYKPSAQDLKTALSSMWRFRKDNIIELSLPFLRLARAVSLVYEGHAAEGVPADIAVVLAGGNLVQRQWENFLAIFLNEPNFKLLFRDMPEGQVALWREVATHHYLGEDKASELLGQPCMSKNVYYGIAPMNSVLSHYFTYVRVCCRNNDGTAQYRSFVCLYPFFQQLALHTFFPRLIHVRPVPGLPAGVALERYNAERVILSRMPLLHSLYKQGRLETGPNDKMPNTTVAAAQRVAGIPEFFPEGFLQKKWAYVAAKMVMNAYSVYARKNAGRGLTASPEEALKNVAGYVMGERALLLPVVMPYLKGLTVSVMYANESARLATMVQSILATWHDQWLEVDNMVMRLRTVNDDGEACFLLMDHNRCERMKLKNGLTDRFIYTDECVGQMCVPFVKGLLFLMGAFGMMELAYRLPVQGDVSYYSCLRYVRLTALGRYVLGLNPVYTPLPDDDERPIFALDDDHLIIQSLVDDNPLDSVVASFARRITPRLYKVTSQTVLAHCATLKDVDGKIGSFYNFVCHEPGEAWTRFFDSVKAHCKPFSKPADKYEVLCVDRDDAELHHLLLTDPVLRRLVVRAEGYVVLVKATDKERLAKALLEHGYLM